MGTCKWAIPLPATTKERHIACRRT